MNILVDRADGRNYITPEDVQGEINAGTDVNIVRLATLEILGGRAGAEDAGLCAFLAFRGEIETP